VAQSGACFHASGRKSCRLCCTCVLWLIRDCRCCFIDTEMLFARLWFIQQELSERVEACRKCANTIRAQDVAREDPDGTLHLRRPRTPACAFRKTVRCNMHCKRLTAWITGANAFQSGYARQSAVLLRSKRRQLSCARTGSRVNAAGPIGQALDVTDLHRREPPAPAPAGLPQRLSPASAARPATFQGEKPGRKTPAPDAG